MVETTTQQRADDDRADAALLRQALGEMRREAEQEVARINLQLRERPATQGGVASAADRLALHQELDTLQRTLGTKERALDSITAECRRLEDALEDQHLVFDGLRKEVERRDISLKVAQEEVDRLRQALLDLQSQAPVFEPAAFPPAQQHESLSSRSRIRSLRYTVWSLVVLLALVVVGGVLWSRVEVPTALESSPVAKQTAPTPEDAPLLPKTSADTAATVPQVLPPVQRDRLRQGALGPVLSTLPGGGFRMGHNLTTANDFGPAHDVQVASFLLGAYEVTFEEYDRFARATGRPLPKDFGWGRGRQPVVGVSWDDARAYAAWLGRETGQAYRLPSEAEWEYAARAGGRGSYWWGFGLEQNRAVCLDCGSRWDNRSPAPVGSFAPSPFGLYDTAGNVMEWVADCYEPGYRGAPQDGSARSDGACTSQVARGGAFNKPSSSMRAYVRARFAPETRLDMLGFRIARDR